MIDSGSNKLIVVNIHSSNINGALKVSRGKTRNKLSKKFSDKTNTQAHNTKC